MRQQQHKLIRGCRRALLKDTFEGNHKIDSGNINLALTIDPTGSTSVSGPIKLSFGGPFQIGR